MKQIVLILLSLFLFSCGSNQNIQLLKKNSDLKILKYINANQLKAKKTKSGLYYIINKNGKGQKPKKNATITSYYRGSFLNGKVFQQTDFRGTTFKLEEVIAGWKEGFSHLKLGAEAIFIIPPHLAYGSKGSNQIPGETILVFEVKLLSIK